MNLRLSEIETVSERGKGLYNKDDAAVMLLAVYQRDGRPQGSAPDPRKAERQTSAKLPGPQKAVQGKRLKSRFHAVSYSDRICETVF